MNQVIKIDERAFNEGVKEVLRLRPLVRVVKTTFRTFSEEPTKPREERPVAKR